MSVLNTVKIVRFLKNEKINSTYVQKLHLIPKRFTPSVDFQILHLVTNSNYGFFIMCKHIQRKHIHIVPVILIKES